MSSNVHLPRTAADDDDLDECKQCFGTLSAFLSLPVPVPLIDLTAVLTRSAASAWWGHAHASDCSCLEAVLQRGKRSGLCSDDVTITADLVGRTDTFE